MQPMLSFIGSLGFGELVIIGIIGLLIFGNRLPSVGRSLGKGIVEFKKGLRGMKDDMDEAMEEAERKAEEKALESKVQGQTASKVENPGDPAMDPNAIATGEAKPTPSA